MTTTTSTAWLERNQAQLVRAFAALRQRLGPEGSGSAAEAVPDHSPMVPPAAIDALTEIFQLSPFERELLLLCAGVEMDSALAARCAEVSGRAPRAVVTFSLAMSVLHDAHWSALAPSSALRRFRLIEMETGQGLTLAPIRIDERILHYLAGVNRLDVRLEGMLQARSRPDWMTEERARAVTESIRATIGSALPSTVLHLCGDDPGGQEGIAAFIAERAGRELYVLRIEETPAAGVELEQFVHLWMREAPLLPALLLLQWEGSAPTPAARALAERLPGTIMIASRDPVTLHRSVERLDVNKAEPSGQKELWVEALGASGQDLGDAIDDVAEQFKLSADSIVSIATSAIWVNETSSEGESLRARLWGACRSVSRPHLESLAQRIVPRASWDDLVLPDLQKETLRQLAAQSRHRMIVYEKWGFAGRGRRGLGLSALFAGPSGTGKTLAAEVIAGDLGLDLYRIDLPSVVSKYIGETEKNLKQVFDAAEAGGVCIVFDEADVFFAKRHEVKDSVDHHTNMEVAYLLQRMETFQGLALLTTNLKSSLDKAFQRRLRFTIDFPFPDLAQREAIWSQVFPKETPTHDLQPARLARLNVTGGNIRNIALNAAFLAADAGTAVDMSHVLRATHFEAAKIERPLSEIETRGWV